MKRHRPTCITFGPSRGGSGAVSWVLQQSVQGSAVVLQDPVSHAAQERVLVGLNLKNTENHNISFWFLQFIKWQISKESNNSGQLNEKIAAARGVCTHIANLFVLSQNMSLKDLFVGGCRLKLRLVQSGDHQCKLQVLHFLYAHLEEIKPDITICYNFKMVLSCCPRTEQGEIGHQQTNNVYS